MTEQKVQTRLDIRQVYIKDLSFESPTSPQSIMGGGANPKIDINLGVRYQRLDEGGHYEVVLTIEANAKVEANTIFLVEVQQAGLFQIQGFGDKEMGLVLNVACPTVLLPFARAAVTDVVSKGGFPQLLINPVNFEMLYAKKTAKADEQPGDGDGPDLQSGPGNGETIN
jgi:preprotein translocase subunit SecB